MKILFLRNTYGLFRNGIYPGYQTSAYICMHSKPSAATNNDANFVVTYGIVCL